MTRLTSHAQSPPRARGRLGNVVDTGGGRPSPVTAENRVGSQAYGPIGGRAGHAPATRRGRPDLDVPLSVLFYRWSRELESSIRDDLRGSGLGGVSGAILLVLHEEQDGLTMSEVAAQLAWPHSNLSTMVRELEAANLGERCADPADGRRRLLRLTPQGHDLARQLITTLAASSPLSRLSVVERRQLLRLLGSGGHAAQTSSHARTKGNEQAHDPGS